jgi:hypothetical protein
MMNLDQGWTARMHLARHQTQWRQEVSDRRQASRRNQIMSENYADHVRRERAVRRAYEAEATRHRTPNGRLVLPAAERLRRYALMDEGKQVRHSGQVYAIR